MPARVSSETTTISGTGTLRLSRPTSNVSSAAAEQPRRSARLEHPDPPDRRHVGKGLGGARNPVLREQGFPPRTPAGPGRRGGQEHTSEHRRNG